MVMPALVYDDGCIRFELDVRVYRLTAIQKAAYRLAGRCTAVIGAPGEHAVPVTLQFLAGTDSTHALSVAEEFFRELLDQELREQIGEETRPLRALILAHAFSRVDLIRRG